MLKIIVVPTQEEQAKIQNGKEPDVSNIFDREFKTEKELSSYIEGLEALPDLAEFDILKDKGLRVTIDFDGTKSDIDFDSVEEKNAYLEGLEDADGWKSPVHYRENEEEYAVLRELLDAHSAKPGL